MSDGDNAFLANPSMHCACIFRRPKDFVPTELVKACAYHGKLADSLAEAQSRYEGANAHCATLGEQAEKLDAEAQRWADRYEKLRVYAVHTNAALRQAEAWITSAPHGDNCFLTDDPPEFNRCYCGRDDALSTIGAALAKIPEHMTTPVPPRTAQAESGKESGEAVEARHELNGVGAQPQYVLSVDEHEVLQHALAHSVRRIPAKCQTCGGSRQVWANNHHQWIACPACVSPLPPYSTEAK